MKVSVFVLIFFMVYAGIAYSSKNFGDNNIDSNNLLLKKDIESGPWETVANVAGDTNLRAGLASGYFGYVSVSMACARNDQGNISDPKACIGGTVAGGAFALYALYRIGGGFLANRRAPKDTTIPMCSNGGECIYITGMYEVPETHHKRDNRELYKLSELDLEEGQQIMSFVYKSLEHIVTHHYDSKGNRHVKVGPNNEQSKREFNGVWLDIYYYDYDIAAVDSTGLINNGDKQQALADLITDKFLEDGNFYSTTCVGFYGNTDSKFSTTKWFWNEESDFPSDDQSVYSGLDPCWDHTL